MKKITFFQHHHNGDLFVSKEYIRQIKNDLPQFEIKYLHNNSSKTLLDLEINQIPFEISSLPEHQPYVRQSNHLFINTWLSSHPEYDQKGNINHNVMHIIFKGVFKQINDFFGVNLQLKEKQDYVARINYSKFNLEKIDAYLKNNNRKKILISNGKPMSRQSFDNDMSEIINELAIKYSNIDFICTEKFKTNLTNILFTDNLTSNQISSTKNLNQWSKTKCDLNEISYLSNHCSIIIGKNSGPYIYCMTETNINDPNKTIIVFNKRSLDSLLVGIDYKAKYVYKNVSHKSMDAHMIKQTIEENLNG